MSYRYTQTEAEDYGLPKSVSGEMGLEYSYYFCPERRNDQYLRREHGELKQAVKAKEKCVIQLQQQLTKLERENKELKRSEKDLQNRVNRERNKNNMLNSMDGVELMLDGSNFDEISLDCDRKNVDIFNSLDGFENILQTLELYGIRLQGAKEHRRLSQTIIGQMKSVISDVTKRTATLRTTVEQLKKENRKLEENLRRQQTSTIFKDELHKVKISRIQSGYNTFTDKQQPYDIPFESPRSCQNCRNYRCDISELKAKISNLEYRSKHTAELLQKSEKYNRQLQDDINHLKSDNISYQKVTVKFTHQPTQLKSAVQLLDEKLRPKPSDMDQESFHSCRNYIDDISDLKRQVSELRDRCKYKEELLEKSEKKTSQLEETIKGLKSDIEKHTSQAAQLKREMQLHEANIRQKPYIDERSCTNCVTYKNKISDLKAEVNRWKRKDELLEKSEKNVIRLTSDNICYKTENEMLKNQATKLKKELQLLEEKIRQKPSDIIFDPASCQNCRNYKNEISGLKTEVSRQKQSDILPDPQQSCQNCRNYRNEISDLKASVIRCKHTAELLENSEKKTRQLQDEINDLKSDNVSYQKDIEELKNQKLQLKNEIQLLEGKLSQASSDVLLDSRNCQHCWIYRNEISDLKVEVNKLRDRLSEAAGNKLRDGNPNIADLSDLNRPTSLAEKFGSLYTDEYTDAMEVIEGTMDEQASVLFLLQLLQRCYDWSKKLAEEQRHMLSVESFGFMKKYLKQPSDFKLPDSCLIYIKEFQKKISADGNNLGAVEMICIEDGMKQVDLKSNQNMKKYMKKCSLLCWMMQISDLPIYLNFDVKVGDKLDKNVYNVFTKSGSQIEFLVWPAMYIHRTGPMLAKGVAQGK